MNASHFWIALDHWGFSAARVLLTVLWQSSILFLATMVLGRLLRRRRATLRHALWVAALLAAPLLPVLTLAGSHLGAPRAPVSVLPTYGEPVELPELPMAPLPPAPSGEAPAPTVAAPEPAPPAPPLSLWDYPWALLLVGYASGVACFLALTVLGRVRLRQWVLGAAPILEERTQLAFAGAGKRLGLRQEVRLLESARVPVPLTSGAFRPVVLLPGGLCARLSDAELCSLALHESAHIRRHDPLTLSVIPLVRALLFLHPLVWLACQQISLLAEQAADDAVLDVTGEPVAYARMLARLAEELRRRSLTTELAAGIVLSKSAFLRRVEAILSDRRDSLRRLSRRALALTILAALLSLFLASALPLTEKESGATKRATTTGMGEPMNATEVNLERVFNTIRQREGRVKTVQYTWTSKKVVPKGSMPVADPTTGLSVPSDLPTEDTEIDHVHKLVIDGHFVRHDAEGLIWFVGLGTGEFVPHAETTVFGADGVERGLFHSSEGKPSGVIGPLGYIPGRIECEAVLQGYRLLDAVLGRISPSEVRLAGRAELRGHPCVLIEKREDVWEFPITKRWWLAQDMGYSVLRWETQRDSAEASSRTDMNYGPDQQIGWRLASWSVTTSSGAHGEGVTSTNVPTDIRLNQPVDAHAFDITFPPGTYVSDELRGVRHVVGDQPETYSAGPLEGDMPFEERVVRVKLKWRLPFHFTDAPLAYLLNLIRAVVGIDFVLDPQLQAEQDKLKVTVSMKETSTEEALSYIITALDLEWSVRDGSVLISPKKPEPAPAPPPWPGS